MAKGGIEQRFAGGLGLGWTIFGGYVSSGDFALILGKQVRSYVAVEARVLSFTPFPLL